MKKIFVAGTVLLVTGHIFTASILVPGLSRPDELIVKDSRIFIADYPMVWIFGLPELKIIKKIGGKGEGPGEFLQYTNISVTDDQLTVSSAGKVSFYDLEGNLLKEEKGLSSTGTYKKAGNYYAGYGFARENSTIYRTIDLYDRDLKKIREIYRFRDFSQREGKEKGFYIVDSTRFRFETYLDSIVYYNMTDFIIHIWDTHEQKEFRITEEHPKIRITPQDKDEYLDIWRKDPRRKEFFETVKSLISFPRHYPMIKGFVISEGLLYVYTYQKDRKGRTEFHIYDLTKMKHEKTVFLPLHGGVIVERFPFTFSWNTLYQLVENTKAEEWEIRITPF